MSSQESPNFFFNSGEGISYFVFYGILIFVDYLMPNPFLYKWTVLFQSIQFSTQFISIWSIDKTLSGATTPAQSELESNGNEEVLCIPQSSRITGTSPSDYLVSYLGHLLGRGSYPFAEMQ